MTDENSWIITKPWTAVIRYRDRTIGYGCVTLWCDLDLGHAGDHACLHNQGENTMTDEYPQVMFAPDAYYGGSAHHDSWVVLSDDSEGKATHKVVPIDAKVLPPGFGVKSRRTGVRRRGKDTYPVSVAEMERACMEWLTDPDAPDIVPTPEFMLEVCRRIRT